MGNSKSAIKTWIVLIIAILHSTYEQLIPTLSAAIEAKWVNTSVKLLQTKLKTKLIFTAIPSFLLRGVKETDS